MTIQQHNNIRQQLIRMYNTCSHNNNKLSTAQPYTILTNKLSHNNCSNNGKLLQQQQLQTRTFASSVAPPSQNLGLLQRIQGKYADRQQEKAQNAFGEFMVELAKYDKMTLKQYKDIQKVCSNYIIIIVYINYVISLIHCIV